MTKPLVTVVGGILYDADGRILLAQRPADKIMPFLWELPGGKLEEGETPEEALCREIYEEVGATVLPCNLKPYTFTTQVYPHIHIVLLVYECLKWEGKVYPREGQEEIKWVEPQDLHTYPMPEANHSIVEVLQTRQPSKKPLHKRSLHS